MKKQYLWLLAALLLCGGLKTWIIVGGWAPFNSDEAVVALMARHIRQGANPIFFYGQAYMGSLDAYLIAGAFSIFGEEVWAIRLVQAVLYLFFLITVYLVGMQLDDNWQLGALAVMLLAFPPVNMTLYTTVSLGGYGEALLIGNLILLISNELMKFEAMKRFKQMTLWVFLGFFSGVGLWAFGLTLVYSLPAVILLIWKSIMEYRRPGSEKIIFPLGWMLFVAGFFSGSYPWWVFAYEKGFAALLGELTGGAIAGVEGLPWFGQVGRHFANLVLFGPTVLIGLRPPWSVNLLVLPLLPLVLIAWFTALLFCFRRENRVKNKLGARLMGLMALTLTLAFIFSPFGADPSGRYFLPLAVPLSICAARGILAIRRRAGGWAYGIAAILIVYQLAGNLQSAMRYPPGLTTQFYAPSQNDHRYDSALIKFLENQGETTGYSNYWVTYPLAFLSHEEIILAPGLPYHLDLRYTDRDNRLEQYSETAANSPKTVYITSNNPQLDERLRSGFSDLKVSWSEVRIGDYQVYYALSTPVHPDMIGLGASSLP